MLTLNVALMLVGYYGAVFIADLLECRGVLIVTDPNCILSKAELKKYQQMIDDYCGVNTTMNRNDAACAFKKLIAHYFSNNEVNNAHDYLLHSIEHDIDIAFSDLLKYEMPVDMLESIELGGVSADSAYAISRYFVFMGSNKLKSSLDCLSNDDIYEVVRDLLVYDDSEKNVCLAYFLCDYLFYRAHPKAVMLVEQLSFAMQIKSLHHDDMMTGLLKYEHLQDIQDTNAKCHVLMQILRNNCRDIQFLSALLESKLRYYRSFGGNTEKRLECEELLARTFLIKEVTLGSVSFFVNRAVKFERATRNDCICLIAQKDLLIAKKVCDEIYQTANQIRADKVGDGMEVCDGEMYQIKSDMQTMSHHIVAKNIDALSAFVSQTKNQDAEYLSSSNGVSPRGRSSSFIFKVGGAALRKLSSRESLTGKAAAPQVSNTAHA